MRKLSCTVSFAAFALFGSLPAAAATEGVNLYGSLEIGPGYDNIKYKKRKQANFGLQTGVGRFGLMGTHAVSDDLSVRFTLESGFSPASGVGARDRMFSREATLGLVHARYGAIDVGRHYNFSALYTGYIDPFGGGYGLSGADTVLGSGLRLDNLVLYQTPNMGGWEGGVGYSFGVNDLAFDAESKRIAAKTGQKNFFRASSRNRLFTTGVKYANGPWTGAAVYDKSFRRNDATDRKNGTSIDAYVLGGAYEFEPYTVFAAFSQTFGGWLSGKNLNYMPEEDQGFRDYHYAKGFSAATGMIGVSADTGPHRFMASWQYAKPKNDRLTGHASPFNLYALGYRYALSKRTQFKSFIAYGSQYAFIDGLSGVQASVRMQHMF